MLAFAKKNKDMNEFFATDRLRAIYPKVKAFLEEEIFPDETEWSQMPFHEVEPILRAKKDQVKATGAWNPYLAIEEGGAGLNLMEVAQLGELLGKTPFGHFTFNAQAPDAGNIELLLKYASDEMREQYLHPLLEGEIRSCFSMTVSMSQVPSLIKALPSALTASLA